MTSDMRRRVIWLGMTVLEVTLLMELSTTNRGERPSAVTTPNFPTAVRWCCSCNSGTPPAFFFRPTPSWLPPGRYTRSIVAKDEL